MKSNLQNRHSRQMILSEVGFEGQSRLNRSKVLVIGLGGLGSPVVQNLAAAGIGHLGIADFDHVELTNLQRQTLYCESDIGKPKAHCAKSWIAKFDKNMEVNSYSMKMDYRSLIPIISDYDLIVDCTDNFKVRYDINTICIEYKKPWVFGAVQGFHGQVAVLHPPFTPCLNCLFPSDTAGSTEVPNCSEIGVLGSIASIIGSIQATEAIKFLVGIEPNLIGRLLNYDGFSHRTSSLALSRIDRCDLCQGAPHQAQTVKLQNKVTLAESISEGEAIHLFNKGKARLVDVGEVPSNLNNQESITISFWDLEMELPKLKKDRKYIFVCESGNKSQIAANMAKDYGLSASYLST